MYTSNPFSSRARRRILFLTTAIASALAPLPTFAAEFWWVGRANTTDWTTSSFANNSSGTTLFSRLPDGFDTIYYSAQNAVNVTNQNMPFGSYALGGFIVTPSNTQAITLNKSSAIAVPSITIESPTNLTSTAGFLGAGTRFNTNHPQSSITVNGEMQFGSSLEKNGPGLLTLNANNLNTALNNIHRFVGGTVLLGHPNALGSNPIRFLGGTLRHSPSNTTDYSASIINSTSPISIDTNAQNVLYASPLAASNTGGLTKLGAATLLLSANSTYTGPTTVSAGVLQLFQNGRISAASPITINSGGSLLLSASDRWGNHTTTSSSAITVNSGGNLTTNDGSYNTLVSPTLNGGTILLNGGFSATFPALSFKGTLTVGGSQPSVINTGTGSFNAINIGPTNAPGTLTIDVADATASPATDLTINAPLQNTPNEAATSTHPSGLTKTGPGTLTLAAANTYTGPTNINGGTLDLAVASAVSTSSAISVNSGGTLSFSRNDIWGGSATTTSAQITVNTGGTLASNGRFNALVNPVLSGGTVLANGGASPLFPAFAFKGTVTVSGTNPSVIALGTGTNNGVAIGVTAMPGVTTFNVANVTSDPNPDLTINVPLQDISKPDFSAGQTSGLTKSGPGTLVLAANNTYTGPTSVIGGTLQLGNGGATGSVSASSLIAVNEGAILAINRSDNLSFSVLFTGLGGLTQMGPGTLTLTSNQGYEGPTTISGGTLQLGNNGTTGSVFRNITNNAALIVSRSDTFFFTTIVSGTGSLTKAGAGTMILTNAQTYTGGTTISSGILQIGNGGTSGSIPGNVVNNSGNFNANPGLQFFRSDNITFPGVISGFGGVRQLGSGVLTLTGASTYTGGTLISAGTVQIGNGGTTGSLTGNILNNAALTFNRSDNLTYSGNISGTGNLTQAGTGTLTLSGPLTYTGNTSITSNGKLILTSPLNTTTGDILLATNSSLDFARPRTTSPTIVSTLDNLTLPSGSIAQVTPSPRTNGTQQAVLIVNSLSITGTGFLDLTNNDLILRNQSLASVRSLVATWLTSANGLPGTTGLGSTSAFYTVDGAFTTLAVYDNSIPSQTLSTFNGIPVLPTDILVKYTYLGDTNLDGVVDASDLSRLLQGLNGQGSGWNFGDINYDGQINFIDLGRLQAALRGQGAPLSTIGSGTPGGVIPEPSSLALLSPLALLLPRPPRATSRHRRR